MKQVRVALIVLAILMLALAVNSEPFTPLGGNYVNGPGMYTIISIPYSPRALPGGTAAIWTNPAGIGEDGGSGLIFAAPYLGGVNTVYQFNDQWGFGINLESLGFGIEATREDHAATRYTWGSSVEFSEGFNLGWAYHWSGGLNRQNSWDLGLLVRPTPWLSIGAQVTEVNCPKSIVMDTLGNELNVNLDPSYHLGLALRPFCPRLTLTADAALWRSNADWAVGKNDYGDNLDPTFTLQLQPIPGFALRAGYAMDSELTFAGISLYNENTELASHSGHRMSSVSGSPAYMGTSWIRISDEFRPEPFAFLDKPKVVTMKLSGKIVEEPEPFSLFRPKAMTIHELLQKIERLEKDDQVKGLLLKFDGLSIGTSDLAEFRESLLDFKAAGKKIFVYSNDYTLGRMYLASVGDLVLVHPAGEVIIPGIGATMPFIRSLLEKLGIEAQVLHVGKYKSAGEILSRDDMSEEAKEAIDAVVETIWTAYTGAIAEGRGISPDEVKNWVDEAMFNADEALEHGLVDGIAFEDQVEEKIKEEFTGRKPRFVSSKIYFMQKPAELVWDDMTSPRIAVVYAVGSIMEGESKRELLGGKIMGSETIAKAIRQARSDSRVKAIVFRIDSGGGSALASDIILREIERTTNDTLKDVRHIPVIVSMSDVAGSGGYYIACKADTIVAPETCITGSIGVIGLKLVLKDLYEKTGISHDGVMRGKHADMWKTRRRWNEDEEKKIMHSMETMYERFVGFVAAGRDLDTSRVHELGQGRIWSGKDALDLGLVDVNGGLLTAIDIAKEAAGIKKEKVVDITFYPVVHGIEIEGEIQYIALKALPETIREMIKTKTFLDAIDQGEPLLLMPIDQESVMVE